MKVSPELARCCVVGNNFLRSSQVAKSDLSDKPVSMQLEVAPQTRRVIEALKTESGVAKNDVVSRVLDWFAAQDEGVRFAILYQRGDAAAELVRIKMAEMAAAGTGDVSGMSLDDAVRAAKVLLDRIQTVGTAYQEQLGVKGGTKRKG